MNKKLIGVSKRAVTSIIKYVFLIILGFVLVYPFFFMVFASFKSNEELFGSASIFPAQYSFEPFIEGWQAAGQFTFTTFYANTFILVIPTVIGTVISSVLVGYGFARFRFPFKKILFTLMIATLMLPNAILVIPRYIIFREIGWLDTYFTFYIPALLGCSSFFTYMLLQFFRSVPMEFDEAAFIDGCNSFQLLYRVHVPLLKPSIISVVIFQTIWTWNNFFDSLIYINSIRKFPLSLALKLSLDTQADVSWGQIMAMATLSMIPCVILFFAMQKYFVEGVASSGLKG